MIYSMTGFASISREFDGGVLTMELRAVNHRYLDLQLRMPEELRVMESSLREKISAVVTRGKVECRINLNLSAGNTQTLEMNQALLRSLVQAVQTVQTIAPNAAPLTANELLRWPGVLATQTLSNETLSSLVTQSLSTLLADFQASRNREGEKLKGILLERLAGMTAHIEAIKPVLPEILSNWQRKLAARLQEALGSADDERVKQEFALFAQKIDVDEELSRLSTHIAEVGRVLEKGGQVGKRLDFLMQELNREANTLGSKSVAVETTRASVELKVLIEQMREQVQNIE